MALTDLGTAAEVLLATGHDPFARSSLRRPMVRGWAGERAVSHLSSLAVRPEHRGRGLAKAVTAALTRQLFAEGMDTITLGMYASNDAGRGVYDALGFADEHRFTSGPLQVRGRW